MTQDPAWLTSLLDEIAEREQYPQTPSFAWDVLTVLDPDGLEPHGSWKRRGMVAGAATLSLGAVVLVTVGVLRRGHARLGA